MIETVFTHIWLILCILILFSFMQYFWGFPITRCGNCGKWVPFWKTTCIELGCGAFTIVCKNKPNMKQIKFDTWTCHICGKKRPDAQISVFKKDTDLGTMNIRYCNDNPDCIKKAKTFSFFSKS